ncbi:hypothetical protein D3C87_841900 [compost metagenome]
MAVKHWGLSSVLVLSLLGCGGPLGGIASPRGTVFRAQGASLPVQVVKPDEVPVSLRHAVHGIVQKGADEASRKRGLDFFTVHANPVGLKLGHGEQAAYVLSFLGTSKERSDLNIEARALVAGGKVGLTHNYSGPGTRVAALDQQMPRVEASASDFRFELLMGLPGNGVTERYERHMERLAQHLTRRFQARPFQFAEDCLVFAVHDGDALAGFLFTHQRNRLVLGDRKDADVQSVVFMSPEAEVLGGYTLLGFNDKTPSPATPPVYAWESERGLGLIAVFGDR